MNFPFGVVPDVPAVYGGFTAGITGMIHEPCVVFWNATVYVMRLVEDEDVNRSLARIFSLFQQGGAPPFGFCFGYFFTDVFDDPFALFYVPAGIQASPMNRGDPYFIGHVRVSGWLGGMGGRRGWGRFGRDRFGHGARA